MAAVNGGGWAPAPDGVARILHLLAEGSKPGADQARVLAQLDQCRAYPDFNAYLAFIFAEEACAGAPPTARQAAGLLLKNNLRCGGGGVDAAGAQYTQFVKSALLRALASPSRPIRATAGTAAASLVAAGGFPAWPELLAALAAALDAAASPHPPSPSPLPSALDTLHKIVEDAPNALEADVVQPDGGTARASAVLVPRLLRAFAAPAPDDRAAAAAVVNGLAGGMPTALIDALPAYVEGLVGLARDPAAPAPRRAGVAGLVALVAAAPDALAPAAPALVDLFLERLADPDPGVALEAADAWPALCDGCADAPPLRDALPRLVPALLAHMVYADGDDEVEAAEAAEAAALACAAGAGAADARADSDLAPFAPGARSAGRATAVADDDDDDDDDGSDGGGRGGGAGSGGAWTLRKACAAALDVLATTFGDGLLPTVTPAVRDALAPGGPSSRDWRAAESAILALGAVADGCAHALAPHLPDVVALLLPRVDDPRPLVRSISCWALSRYGHWIAAAAGAAADADAAAGPPAPPASAAGAAALDAVLGAVARRVAGDGNPRVQEAAASSLATLVEAMGPHVAAGGRLAPLVDALARGAARCGRGAARMLYDAVATLADAAGPALADPPLPDALLPPLLARWDALGDGDREVLPLLECLTSVAAAVGGAGLGARAAPLFARAVAILAAGTAARAAATAAAGAARAASGDGSGAAAGAGGGTPPASPLAGAGSAAAAAAAAAGPERDFLVAALDLVSGLAEGLGASLAPLAASPAGAPLLPCLVAACGDPDPDVRQSAFALAGDLARAAPAALAPSPRVLADLLALAAARLDPAGDAADGAPAANNACWALGELALRAPPDAAAAAAAAAAPALAALLTAPAGAAPRSLVENAAITLGRLAWTAPAAVAPDVGAVLRPWCAALRGVRDDVEKEHAFLGLAAVLRANPAAGAPPNFAPLAEAVSSWRSLRGDLAADLPALLASYQAALGPAGWAAAAGGLAPAVREKLAQLCGV